MQVTCWHGACAVGLYGGQCLAGYVWCQRYHSLGTAGLALLPVDGRWWHPTACTACHRRWRGATWLQ